MKDSKVFNRLKKIPVYPDYIILTAQDSCNFSTNAPLCEDEGRFSYISKEAKDKYLRSYKARIIGGRE